MCRFVMWILSGCPYLDTSWACQDKRCCALPTRTEQLLVSESLIALEIILSLSMYVLGSMAFSIAGDALPTSS